jgi:hypothetical protein
MRSPAPRPLPPIAASLILPAIFGGQPVRPYALNFFVFSFFYIVFLYFLFDILFLFFSPVYFFSFIFFLSFSSYSSYSSRTILRLLILLFLYLNLFFCITDMQGAKPFLIHLGPKYICTCATILFFCSYLFLFLSSDLFLFFSYNILLLLILVLQTCVLKVHKNENFYGFDFEFCPISLLVMHK